MIRRSRPVLVLLFIALCIVAACAIWMTAPGTAPQQQPATLLPPRSDQLAPAAPSTEPAQEIAAHILPDPRFTPGAINPDVTEENIGSTICVPGFTKTIRPPARYTSRLKREQLDDPARGYDDREMRDYEEDHEIPLEVGGNPTDARNLWPEPCTAPGMLT